MISFLLITLLLITIITYMTFRFSIKENIKEIDKNKTTPYFFFSVALVFSISVISYLHKSNYWIGDNIFEKFIANKNLQQLNEMESLLYFIEQLEDDIKKDPEDYEKIKKLAETKYLLGKFSEAYQLFKVVKNNMPNELEVLVGEANSKLFLEEGNPSKSTVKLFQEILNKDENNPLALLILGDNELKENNLLNAKNLYLSLLNLLKKDSKEYTEINNKINSIEERLNEEKER